MLRNRMLRETVVHLSDVTHGPLVLITIIWFFLNLINIIDFYLISKSASIAILNHSFFVLYAFDIQSGHTFFNLLFVLQISLFKW